MIHDVKENTGTVIESKEGESHLERRHLSLDWGVRWKSLVKKEGSTGPGKGQRQA